MGTSPPYVEPPTPSPAQATACTSLAARLPAELRLPFTPTVGRSPVARRTAVVPASPFTAGWGSPPVVLRCGVEPAGVSQAQLPLEGVTWFEDAVDATRWGTRTPPYLAVTIPAGNPTGITGPLLGITDALLAG